MRKLWETHDLLVVVAALVLLGGGWVLAARAERPSLHPFAAEGVTVQVPAGWLREPGGDTVRFRGDDALSRLEIEVLPRADATLTIESHLELGRGQRYGQLYQRLATDKRTIRGKEWLRTEYVYAFKPSETHAPRLARAVELAYPADAAVVTPKLWVITLHGPDDSARELEPWVLGSVEVAP